MDLLDKLTPINKVTLMQPYKMLPRRQCADDSSFGLPLRRFVGGEILT
jgi:hypothetical protein